MLCLGLILRRQNLHSRLIEVSPSKFPQVGKQINREGESPLHLATQEGYDDVVAVLLREGVCQPNMQDKKG